MKKLNYVRRTIGVIICSLPVVLAISSILWDKEVSNTSYATGLILIVLSILVGLLNINLLSIKPRLYKHKHKTMEGYKFISGLPMVGTMLQVFGCVVAFGSDVVGLLALLTILIDIGGLFWVPVITWNDDSLWDN